MSRKILCEKDHIQMRALARKYDEHYLVIKGTAKGNFICDSCGISLKQGSLVFAIMLLPNERHPNAKSQDPRNWAHDYLEEELPA